MMASSIGPNDVLSGRGGATNNHPGNKRFRSIVADHMPEYLEARKKHKAVIARRIVNLVKQDGGRFLKRSTDNDTWIEVTDKKATEKTAQALREGLDVRHKKYRPEKMPRRDSEDSSHENPRKKTRLVMGKVVDSPQRQQQNNHHITMIRGRAWSYEIPDLKAEEEDENSSNNSQQPAEVDPLFKYFEPPRITKSDCDDVACV